MMQVCYTSEALQYFIIALSSQDEAFRLRASCPGPSDLARTKYLFSLKEYSKAIEKAVAESRHGQGGLVMVASAVFCYLYELWFGDMLGAQKHALTAEKLVLVQNQSADNETNDMMSQHMRPAIARLCAQFSGSSSTDGFRAGSHNNPDVVSQEPLKDCAEAKASLASLTNLVFMQAEAYSQSNNDDVDSLQQHIKQLQLRLDQWYDEYLRLRRQLRKNESIGSKQGRHVLEIRYRYFKINLAVLPFQSETLYDNHLEDFRSIVDACEEILKYTARQNPGCHRSAEMTPILALSFVGLSCRDPHIRRRATRLLCRYRRQEGVWSSLACANITEQVSMLEEEGIEDVQTCSDIPAKRRVRSVCMRYDSGQNCQPAR